MGLIFLQLLPGPKVFKCRCCSAHLASRDAVISKDFNGRYGRAYLLKRAVNVCLGPSEERTLMTGLHLVNDIYCCSCRQILGWRYEKAFEESQKYKEGKYILEKARLMKEG
ncbi:putative yippee-like protein Os10g0369500 [Wolffia australiana]